MENVQVEIFEKERVETKPYYNPIFDKTETKRYENKKEFQERLNRFLIDHTIYSITPMINGDFDEESGGFTSKILVCYKAPGREV
ncbi:hypothetical protein AB4G91_10920 [Macrococcoides goetzii]|uniref:hypothetical protein n=1 Tax=Macrococcus sp. PK TaxID=2801919 RepID=UPI001F0FBBB7|nr:hypothetical protein [Macrococcus sp. PK]MCH4985349.1 hypothetical protein [Macrococcus sp. PK]